MSLSIDLRASSWLSSSVLLTPLGANPACGVLSQNTVHLDGEEHDERQLLASSL
jgi:hypothetical protein